MKKATATVIFDSKTKRIMNFSITRRRSLINLESALFVEREFDSFQAIYQYILDLAKANGFYFDSYKAFGLEWFDIQWIDVNDFRVVNKFGIKKGA